jgi:hypothetical protein
VDVARPLDSTRSKVTKAQLGAVMRRRKNRNVWIWRGNGTKLRRRKVGSSREQDMDHLLVSK